MTNTWMTQSHYVSYFDIIYLQIKIKMQTSLNATYKDENSQFDANAKTVTCVCLKLPSYFDSLYCTGQY